MKKLPLTLLGVLLLTSCSKAIDPITANPQTAAELHLASKTPYQPQQSWQQYSQAPAGFNAVMVQHVARHGSRLLSSAGDDDLALQLWRQAKQLNALTPLGEQLYQC